MNENALVCSKRCQLVTRGGKTDTVKVEIHCSGGNDGILEVVYEDNNSTVWDDQFDTDDEATSLLLFKTVASKMGDRPDTVTIAFRRQHSIQLSDVAPPQPHHPPTLTLHVHRKHQHGAGLMEMLR